MFSETAMSRQQGEANGLQWCHLLSLVWQVSTLRAAESSDLFATADAHDSVRLFEFTPGLHRSFRVRICSNSPCV